MVKKEREFPEILSSCYQRIFRKCLSILKDQTDAEDAAQEVQLRVTRLQDSYRPTEYPCAWFVTIAQNHCLDELRKRRRQGITESISTDDEWRFTHALIPPPDDTSTRLLVIEDCLKRLTAREEEVIRLFLLEDLTWPEVAEMLGTTVGSVRNDYERARRRLRPWLEAAGFDVSD
jgi:RNA polymerase sigma-70 factor, ECF subfamily